MINSYDISKRNVNETIIKNHWIESDNKILRNKAKLSTLRKNWLKIMEPVIEVMVMEEMKKPRDNYLLNRGSYLEPSHKVGTDVPENLPKMDSSLPKNRLGLAKWLFSNENPLTSRVTVNRYWQMIFGFGLVRTPEDFGVQGMLPSHPELLDWLSIYLINNNWNIKKLIKLMVMSHVYQQKSNSNDKLNEIDPNNFFLARSNSYKLPAEIIRDNVEMFTNKQSNPLLNLLSPRTLSKAAENVDEGIQNADPRNPKHSTAIKSNIDILKALSGLDRGRDSNGSLNINVSLLKKNWGANQDVVDAEIQEEPEE